MAVGRQKITHRSHAYAPFMPVLFYAPACELAHKAPLTVAYLTYLPTYLTVLGLALITLQ